MNVLLIDNFDSFTFNLAYEFESRNCKVEVWRNDVSPEFALDLAQSFDGPKLIVISPGPGSPEEAGCSVPLIQFNQGRVPLFGVCLGHQAITQAFGGKVGRLVSIFHGKSSQIAHDGQEIFEGLEQNLRVGRYHSLAALELPECLQATARWNDVIMAVRHKTQPVTGVQFHPESILTTEGGRLIDNVISWATKWHDARATLPS